MEFKIGDIVEWCGVRGYIASEDADGDGFLLVMFPTAINQIERNAYFEKNGKYRNWHAEPSLKLIESPKKRKKVKKYKVLFKDQLGEWQMSSSHYKTVQDFDCVNIYEDKHTLPQTQIEVEE